MKMKNRSHLLNFQANKWKKKVENSAAAAAAAAAVKADEQLFNHPPE